MAHNFKDFPELTNEQMEIYYLDSPHKQITESFTATCTKVHDGDTITLKWSERDFEFPVRFANISAPELNEDGGKESRDWLKEFVEGKEVDIIINANSRVDKWGRLLGLVQCFGIDAGEASINAGHATTWAQRNESKIMDNIPNLESEVKKWRTF